MFKRVIGITGNNPVSQEIIAGLLKKCNIAYNSAFYYNELFKVENTASLDWGSRSIMAYQTPRHDPLSTISTLRNKITPSLLLFAVLCFGTPSPLHRRRQMLERVRFFPKPSSCPRPSEASLDLMGVTGRQVFCAALALVGDEPVGADA